MSYNYGPGPQQPHLAATFYPGGTDDFYMPEVISPAPQRIMPEVPEQMQDNIAHMENNASGYPGYVSSPPPQHGGFDHQYGNQPQYTEAGNYPNYEQHHQPNFSPFPQLHNRPNNIPPSDEEKEATLEQARVGVIHSNDPEMQLSWAEDTLNYCDVALQHESRLAEIQGPRSHTPQAEHQLRVDAIEITTFLADQEHPRGLFLKGTWLEFGRFGFRVDKKEAFRCYKRAADKGYARANYRIGMQFENGNDPASAFRYYEIGASLHDSASNYRLGMMSLLGQCNQPIDYARGVELIHYAAEGADSNAPQGAYIYGMLLAQELDEIRVPEGYLSFDINEARQYIEKAAFLGFAKAQVKMGSAYELCQLGCDFNPAFSLHYNALAARQGDPAAEMAVSKWFLCGAEGIFEKNDELAFLYAHRAALQELHSAEFAMGYFHEVGIHVQVNIDEANLWYSKAADHGNMDAVGRLEGISRHKTLSRQDHEQVAVARIKSTHGSQRGQRPARFRHEGPPVPSLPPITDSEPIEIPDPSRMTLNDPPPRSASAAPYPIHGDGSGFQQDPRPRTAFGFNPNVRPPTGPPRPNSAMAPGAPGARPPPGRPGAPPGRMPSGGPQGYRKPTPGLPPNPRPGPPPNNMPPGQGPRVDIGFSAPIEARRPNPHNRPATAQGHPPNRISSRTQGLPPHPQSNTNQLAGSQSVAGSQSSAANNRPVPSRQHTLPTPSKPTPTPPPAQRPPPKTQSSGSTVTIQQGTPSKGPKTFSEMGVQAQKNDGDCAIDISTNLHNRVTKTYAAKTLKELHERKEIAGKASGKQLVYHALQQTTTDPATTIITVKDLESMDTEISTLREKLTSLKSQEKSLKATFLQLNSTVSVSELRGNVRAMEGEREGLLERLGVLRMGEGDSKPVATAEQIGESEREWKKWKRVSEVRRRICKEMWGIVGDNLPEGTTTKDEFWEELGLEGTL
ncbi:MAG: hypothetical protein M1834_001340 [Cirrosporium novae-zelandiae]|nr:MAG: hypothetical protein M1834_001340 [Cirrosporium novae-zelandiae]